MNALNAYGKMGKYGKRLFKYSSKIPAEIREHYKDNPLYRAMMDADKKRITAQRQGNHKLASIYRKTVRYLESQFTEHWPMIVKRNCKLVRYVSIVILLLFISACSTSKKTDDYKGGRKKIECDGKLHTIPMKQRKSFFH